MVLLVFTPPRCSVSRYRQSVRVSMGHCCRLPIVRCDSLADTLRQLHLEADLISYAAVIDQDALKLISLPMSPHRWCAVVGNEDKGISPAVREACTYRVRIDMYPTVDSLAITVAAGITLNGLREREGENRGWD